MELLQNVATASFEIKNLKSKELRDVSMQIIELGRKTTENTLKQFKLMQKVYEEELYMKDFFKDGKDGKKKAFGDYAKKVFGLETSTAYKMVQVAQTFLAGAPDGKSIFCDEYGNDFTPSALIEMLPKKQQGNNGAVTVEEITKAVSDGTITSDDSVRDIRDTIRTKIRGIEKPESKQEVVRSEKQDINILIAELKNYAKRQNDKFLLALANKMAKAVAK